MFSRYYNEVIKSFRENMKLVNIDLKIMKEKYNTLINEYKDQFNSKTK